MELNIVFVSSCQHRQQMAEMGAMLARYREHFGELPE